MKNRIMKVVLTMALLAYVGNSFSNTVSVTNKQSVSQQGPNKQEPSKHSGKRANESKAIKKEIRKQEHDEKRNAGIAKKRGERPSQANPAEQKHKKR